MGRRMRPAAGARVYNTAPLFTSVTRVIVAVQPGQSVELSALISPAWKMARAAGVRLALTMTALGSPEIVSTYDNTGGEGVTVRVIAGESVRVGETVSVAEGVAVPEAVTEGGAPFDSEDVGESVEGGVPEEVATADAVIDVAGDASLGEAMAEGMAVVTQPYTIEGLLHPFVLQA